MLFVTEDWRADIKTDKTGLPYLRDLHSIGCPEVTCVFRSAWQTFGSEKVRDRNRPSRIENTCSTQQASRSVAICDAAWCLFCAASVNHQKEEQRPRRADFQELGLQHKHAATQKSKQGHRTCLSCHNSAQLLRLTGTVFETYLCAVLWMCLATVKQLFWGVGTLSEIKP